MSKRLLIVLAAGWVPAAAPGAAMSQERRGDAPDLGFVSLFNGKDLSGWHGLKTMDPRKFAALSADEKAKALAEGAADVKKHWRVQDGVIVNDGQGAYLTSDKDYGDIELKVDFKIGPKGDSGVYLRGNPQVQIWDFTEPRYARMGADKGSGGLWNNSPGAPGKDPLTRADKPVGEWNSFRIIQVGERTTVYLNDKLVVDHARWENYWDRKLPLVARGPIQLQTHDHEIHWRNIAVREIPPDEANEILAKHGDAGFRPIFNGQNLADWAGPVENYEVQGGILKCKPHKGGTIYFNQEYTDFAARVEFKLPPGGNNGLAIRFPGGAGDTAYQGMCELQILDDTDRRYARTLDPRQAHGSAYGMVAAQRGYLRPVGQWNFQEVTVKGSKIKVELNGTVILDTDLSQVKEFMANNPHPGKDRTSGYFGFAGHNDPVEFRSVSIKPLD
ncbi:MAG TPA: DUF1080 domain-containing protein [Isosphaeraceae bacterium]|nr:DUF1080 domain-containing protein [Isosphaeraceae bacterium]